MPTRINGGRHPNPNNTGRIIFPIREPILPNINISDIAMVLKLRE